jgi:hypothetical protein
MKSKFLYVGGGIGDFLQMTPFMLENKNYFYLVHTHYKKANNYFDFYKIKNLIYLYFETNEQRAEQLNCLDFDLVEIPRKFFFNYAQTNENKIKINNLFQDKKPIVGIHPFGSSYSNATYKQFQLPEKIIDNQLLNEITNENPDFNYLLFGSQNELNNYKIKESKNIKFISFDSINESLMSIKSCFKFIGTDSCFKNMACMNKIKTLCICGNFDDYFRDENFMNPYLKENIMEVVKYNKVENQKETTKAKINEFLKN